MATDLSEALYDWLTTSDDAASYRAVVANIREAGFIDIDLLNDAVQVRRTSGASQILATSIQDAGDSPIPVRNERASVVIRHYDRGYGYKNLRTARDLLRETLRDFTCTLSSVAGYSRGVIELAYVGRSGHRRDLTFNRDWEALTYNGIVLVED